MTMSRHTFCLLMLLSPSVIPVLAQDERQNLPWFSPELTAHVLVQAGTTTRIGSDPSGGTYANAVTAHTSRLQVLGMFDNGFDYNLEWEFTQSPALLETRIGYRITSILAVDIGRFKTPMGREFLTPSQNTDFVSGASLLSLSPGRDAGVQARLDITNTLQFRAGVFNGTGGFLSSDNTDPLAIARVSYSAFSNNGTYAAGFSAGIDPETPGGGSYSLATADVRIETPRLLAVAEILYVSKKPVASAPLAGSYGLYITLGTLLSERSDAKVRFQRIFPSWTTGPADDLILIFSYSPDERFSLSIEGISSVTSPVPYHIPPMIRTQVQMYL